MKQQEKIDIIKNLILLEVWEDKIINALNATKNDVLEAKMSLKEERKNYTASECYKVVRQGMKEGLNNFEIAVYKRVFLEEALEIRADLDDAYIQGKVEAMLSIFTDEEIAEEVGWNVKDIISIRKKVNQGNKI